MLMYASHVYVTLLVLYLKYMYSQVCIKHPHIIHYNVFIHKCACTHFTAVLIMKYVHISYSCAAYFDILYITAVIILYVLI